MLKELYIKNIAVIDELRIPFKNGFQVLTGETGAGKSILVEAIGLILGNKASSSLIRDGAKEAIVEASFDLTSYPDVQDLLKESLLTNEDGPLELIIKRQISLEGQNRILINHQKATLSLLQSISKILIDFTGQHEQIRLLDSQNDIHIIDSFLPSKKILEDYRVSYTQTKNSFEKLSALQKSLQNRNERLEWLKFQLKDFEGLQIRSTEEEAELRLLRNRLKNQEKINRFERQAADSLVEGDGSCLEQIRSLSSVLIKNDELAEIYPEVLGALENIQTQIEDLSYSISKTSTQFHRDLDFSLEEVDQRLYHSEKLKRKFGPELMDVLQKQQELNQEIADLENVDEQIDVLKKQYQQNLQFLQDKALELSKARHKLKLNLEKKVKEELKFLQMPNVQFEVVIDTKKDLGTFENYKATGIDQATFMLSPNPGLSPKPLAKIASGGETSRIFLALKQVLAEKRNGGTLIFDEIDTGISGAAVELVGKKLKSLASHFQVFCVTHHAQIASQADQHYFVRKDIQKDKTITRVQTLAQKERIEEIARLMGGVKITEKNLAFARELVKNR